MSLQGNRRGLMGWWHSGKLIILVLSVAIIASVCLRLVCDAADAENSASTLKLKCYAVALAEKILALPPK